MTTLHPIVTTPTTLHSQDYNSPVKKRKPIKESSLPVNLYVSIEHCLSFWMSNNALMKLSRITMGMVQNQSTMQILVLFAEWQVQCRELCFCVRSKLPDVEIVPAQSASCTNLHKLITASWFLWRPRQDWTMVNNNSLTRNSYSMRLRYVSNTFPLQKRIIHRVGNCNREKSKTLDFISILSTSSKLKGVNFKFLEHFRGP